MKELSELLDIDYSDILIEHSDVNLRNFFEFKTKKRRILRVSEQWYKMYDWERIPY